jgi:hypothetical protein
MRASRFLRRDRARPTAALRGFGLRESTLKLFKTFNRCAPFKPFKDNGRSTLKVQSFNVTRPAQDVQVGQYLAESIPS